MTWIEKDRPSLFDEVPIPGLFLLNGNFLFALTRDAQYQGVKRAMIALPSGSNRALWPPRHPEQEAEFYLFGEMGLPVRASLEEVLGQATQTAAEFGYGVARVGESELEVWDERDHDHFRVSYDASSGYVHDAVSMRPPGNQAGEGNDARRA
jgi:hypothetical protein